MKRKKLTFIDLFGAPGCMIFGQNGAYKKNTDRITIVEKSKRYDL